MSTNKLRQFALAMKMLTQRDNLHDALLELGLSPRELQSVLEVILAEQQELELTTFEPGTTVSGRVFSPWERLILSTEAQSLLLSALHTEVITPSELEETLATLITQTTGFVGIEEVCTVLEDVVQDDLRIAVLMSYEWEYLH